MLVFCDLPLQLIRHPKPNHQHSLPCSFRKYNHLLHQRYAFQTVLVLRELLTSAPCQFVGHVTCANVCGLAALHERQQSCTRALHLHFSLSCLMRAARL